MRVKGRETCDYDCLWAVVSKMTRKPKRSTPFGVVFPDRGRTGELRKSQTLLPGLLVVTKVCHGIENQEDDS
jgi:hypothetical protein